MLCEKYILYNSTIIYLNRKFYYNIQAKLTEKNHFNFSTNKYFVSEDEMSNFYEMQFQKMKTLI